MLRKTKIIAIIAIFFWAALSEIAYCAPSVQSITGSINNGGSVVVNGAGFGTGDTSPMVWDDFEDGENGQNLAESPKIGTWSLNNKPIPKYTSSQFHSGSKGSIGSSTSGNIYTQFSVPASGRLSDSHYYVSWWGKYSNPCSTSGQAKLIQLWGTYKQGDYNPGFFCGPGSATYIALENSGTTEKSWISYPAQDEWALWELILRQSDPNVANGVIQVKVDGDTIYSKTNVKTRERSSESWEKLIPWEGMTNQSGCTGARYLAMDNFYMNNSWSRVVIGNKATYSACTQKEIQIPSTWSSTNIQVTVNTGAFGDNQQAYLYVVDSNGLVNNNGYPVTIGEGAVSGSTALLPPPSVRVEN